MNKNKHSDLLLIITALFCSCLIISNVAAFKMILLGPITITSAVLLFPITYIVNDVIAEVYGFQKAKMIIWLGFAMNALAVLYFQLTIAMPSPSFFTGGEAYATVLGGTFRILCASLSAYLVGSLVNAKVMVKMKKATNGKHLAARAILSTFCGEGLDSIIFITGAFLGTMPTAALLIMILTQTLVKTGYEIIVFPLTAQVISSVKKYEGVK